MTITIGWWFWPALLFVVGLVVAIIDYMRDGSGGDYGSIGQGCMGACICAACWLLALGLLVGRWLA